MNKRSSMSTFPLKSAIHISRFAVLLTIEIILLSTLSLSSMGAQDESESAVNSPDMLGYISDDDQLMLYDPRNHTETTLLENVSSFVLGRDGRVAFNSADENDTDLYMFDPATPSLAPINISQNPAAFNYPLDWSPDGRYLVFVSLGESSDYSQDVWIYQGLYQTSSMDKSLYVWDGEKTINIMPDNPLDTAYRFYIDWSDDGRLVFTIEYGWSDLDTPAEIYLWDGNTTMNLSQNPNASDTEAIWSSNGQLMFGSYRDEEGHIYVWDGVTFKDGSPDVDSFIRLAPELDVTSAIWTDAGLIGFTVNSDSGTKEIMLWDLEQEAIVNQFPVSSENEWSVLSSDGQMIRSSQLASGMPSVYLDIENTEGEILFSAEVGDYDWSSDSYLAYCRWTEARNWILTFWDGEETWDVATVSYRPVQWQNGQRIFSCNNG